MVAQFMDNVQGWACSRQLLKPTNKHVCIQQQMHLAPLAKAPFIEAVCVSVAILPKTAQSNKIKKMI